MGRRSINTRFRTISGLPSIGKSVCWSQNIVRHHAKTTRRNLGHREIPTWAIWGQKSVSNRWINCPRYSRKFVDFLCILVFVSFSAHTVSGYVIHTSCLFSSKISTLEITLRFRLPSISSSHDRPCYMRFSTLKKIDEFLKIDESCERASFPDQHNTCGNRTINVDHPKGKFPKTCLSRTNL